MAPPRRVPLRTCVACRSTDGKKALLRVVRDPESGRVEFDPTGKRPGRGAYVCGSVECIVNAAKRKAFERSLKATLIDPCLGEQLLGACPAPSQPPPPDAVS